MAIFLQMKWHRGGLMRKAKIVVFGAFLVFLILSGGILGIAQMQSENQKILVHSVLVICPFPEVEKRQIVENAFVNALNKITSSTGIYPYIGTISRGEEVTRDEFIKRVNDKKIEALLFIQIKGISSNLENMGGSPEPFSPSSEDDEAEGEGYSMGKPRAAKTRFQANLVDFRSGKSLWKEASTVLGDIWLSLSSVSKTMAKKTAKQLKKTGLMASK
jgi:hypothetical protein